MRAASLVLAVALAGVAGAQSGTPSLRNDSSVAMASVRVSPIDAGRFGVDLLGGAALAPGARRAFRGLAPGLYDMQVEFAGGATCLVKDIDYFQYGEWALGEDCRAFVSRGR